MLLLNQVEQFIASSEEDTDIVTKAKVIFDVLPTVEYLQINAQPGSFMDQHVITKYLIYKLVHALVWFKYNKPSQDITMYLEDVVSYLYGLLVKEKSDLVYAAFLSDEEVTASIYGVNITEEELKQFHKEIKSRLKLLILTF